MNRYLANYTVVEQTPEAVVLRDLGPWDQYMTVTNDAEHVVEELVRQRILQPGAQRLFYYDSEGQLDEIIVNRGRFGGFRPATRLPHPDFADLAIVEDGRPWLALVAVIAAIALVIMLSGCAIMDSLTGPNTSAVAGEGKTVTLHLSVCAIDSATVRYSDGTIPLCPDSVRIQ